MPTCDREIRTFQRRYMCDVPGCSGELLPVGAMLMSDPPKFLHRCSACLTEKVFAEKYPLVVYHLVESI